MNRTRIFSTPGIEIEDGLIEYVSSPGLKFATSDLMVGFHHSSMIGQLSEEQQQELLAAARTAVGDELRSLMYFTEETYNQVYLRHDLEQTADLVGFAENERFGFRSQQAYAESELGKYQFTIRVFENGYLTRVIVRNHGVWVTTDGMPIDRFEELGSALTSVLDTF